jgi:drug/metabolite transporter, DME family
MLIAASTLWSLSGVVVKVVHVQPIAFAFYRSLAAAVAAALAVPLMSGRAPPVRPMVASGVLYTLVVALLISAMTAGTAASGILLQYTGPVFCAVFAVVFQGRRLTRRTIIALAIATAGVAVMVHGNFSGNLTVPVCGVASGVAFGALILVLELVDPPGLRRVNPLLVVAINNGAAALLLLVPVLLWGHDPMSAKQIGLILATGVVQLAIPYLLFQLGLRRVQPVDASLLILLEPVLNPVWVWLAVGEMPERATFIGGAAILVTLIMEATKPATNRAA